MEKDTADNRRDPAKSFSSLRNQEDRYFYTMVLQSVGANFERETPLTSAFSRSA